MQVLVRSAPLKHHFNVILVLSLVRRCLLHVDHCAGLHEGVVWVGLRRVQSQALIRVKTPSEIVAINYSEVAFSGRGTLWRLRKMPWGMPEFSMRLSMMWMVSSSK